MILCRTTVLYLVSVSKGAFLIVMIHSYTPCNSGINFPTLPVMQSANLGMFWYSTEETESAVSVKVSHGFQKCYKCLDRGASTLESEGLTRAVHNPHTEMSTRVIRSRRVVVGSESSSDQSRRRVRVVIVRRHHHPLQQHVQEQEHPSRDNTRSTYTPPKRGCIHSVAAFPSPSSSTPSSTSASWLNMDKDRPTLPTVSLIQRVSSVHRLSSQKRLL